ncbi:MAG: DUF4393 domain-containing protein [Burkholderiales bacterium]|nr:DUF4393 domain-containing protein [Opitutaceae bacterium]
MSIEIQISGKGLSKSIRDLFSPATELAGALGDQVRIYREIAVLKTLDRVKSIAQSRNLKLQPPPLKFFVPFLENCSLEDHTDSPIAELWANLLVSASTNYSPQHNLFIRILREITRREAEAFQYIAYGRNKEPPDPISLYNADLLWGDTSIYITIRDALEATKKPMADIDFVTFESDFKAAVEGPGSILTYLNVAKGKKNQYPITEVFAPSRDFIDDNFESMSFIMLRNLGLLSLYQSPELWFKNFVFEVQSLYITELGAAFYEACTPPLKNDARAKRAG